MMDIPKEIEEQIEQEAEKRFPVLHLSQNAPANSRRNKRSFIEGAIYWYRYSQKELDIQHKLMISAEQRGIDKAKEELEEKDIKLQALELAFEDKVKEIERLKDLLKKQTFLIYPWPKQREEMWEQFKTDNNL